MTQAMQQSLTDAHADDIIDWIKQQDFFTRAQAPNYTVGITADTIIISKVGGVTSATGGMSDLKDYIKSQTWYPLAKNRVYLARKFSTAVDTSNHGEMCVLAAALDLGKQLTYLKCSAKNCKACARTLSDYDVPTGNDTSSDTQTGWVHPVGAMACGTAYNTDWSGQITELHRYNEWLADDEDEDAFTHSLTKELTTSPQGKHEKFC